MIRASRARCATAAPIRRIHADTEGPPLRRGLSLMMAGTLPYLTDPLFMLSAKPHAALMPLIFKGDRRAAAKEVITMPVSKSSGTPPHRSAFRAITAWIPLALSAAAIALLAGYFATGPHAPNLVYDHGVTREDESAVARLWQLIMLAQVAASLAFAGLWLPRDGKRAAIMLGLQAIGFLVAAAPVYLFEHGYPA